MAARDAEGDGGIGGRCGRGGAGGEDAEKDDVVLVIIAVGLLRV